MIEASKGFRQLKAPKQLPGLRAALRATRPSAPLGPDLDRDREAA